MSKKDRLLQFVQVYKRDKNTGQELHASDVADLLTHYNTLKSNKNKIKEINKERIGMIADLHEYTFSSTTSDKKFYYGYFLSATHSYRPDLINRRTGDKRSSPKMKDEGEIEKTHFGLIIDSDSSTFMLEVNKKGLTYNQLMILLSVYYEKEPKKNFNLKSALIVTDNWIEILNSASSVKEIEIITDYKILGSPILNITNNYESIKDNVKIVITAENKEKFKAVGIELASKLSLLQFSLKNIKMKGRDNDDNEFIINQSAIEKRVPFKVNVDSNTGEYVTADFYDKIKQILDTY